MERLTNHLFHRLVAKTYIQAKINDMYLERIQELEAECNNLSVEIEETR